MTDFKLVQTNDGGDLVIDRDVAVVADKENLPYLAIFGGDADWWANNLLFNEDPWQSKTPAALRNNALNSQGRVNIENAVKDDLKALDINADVSVTITGVDQVKIQIDAQEFIINAKHPDDTGPL